MDQDLHDELKAVIIQNPAGQSPLWEDIEQAVGAEPICSFYIRPETVFDIDSVYEHLMVYILTPARLLTISTDTIHDLDERGEWATTIHTIRIAQIKEHIICRRRGFTDGGIGELNSVFLRLRWGLTWTQEIHPASCDDPACVNEHGYVAVVTNEDMGVFIDREADEEQFARGLHFVAALEAAIARND
ncbi:DUF5998 family protein [Trueperella sp. LYQ141]|uniref:DUF5998 family protein n=1 Tax=Trueperella sp. LYQ141 TaxID=3391058 RepID=UPI00398360C0